MDWALAIERNRQPLLRIVAALFAMIGLTETGAVERLSRPVYRAVLGVLRPAEAAVRRLIESPMTVIANALASGANRQIHAPGVM